MAKASYSQLKCHHHSQDLFVELLLDSEGLPVTEVSGVVGLHLRSLTSSKISLCETARHHKATALAVGETQSSVLRGEVVATIAPSRYCPMVMSRLTGVEMKG